MFTWLRQFIICWQMISMRPTIFSFFLSFFILLCSSEYLIAPNYNNFFPYTSSTRFFFLAKSIMWKKALMYCFIPFRKPLFILFYFIFYKTTALNYMCVYIYIYLWYSVMRVKTAAPCHIENLHTIPILHMI